MKQFLLSLPLLALAAMPVAALAEITPEQLQALEARIAQLEAERNSAPVATDSAIDKLKINGFMSAGFGRADIDDFSFDGLGEGWSHDTDAAVGMQIDGQVNEQMHAVLQLTGRGNQDDFDISAEWAYIGYRPTDTDEIRIGRQRFPFFMMSEYLDVGYSYPWAKPPVEVYLPGMPSSYDGISWQHNFSTGDWTHSSQLYWGSDEFPSGGGTFELEDSLGGSWMSAVGNWQFGATYSQGKSTFGNSFFDALAGAGAIKPLDGDIGWYGGISLQYDNGKLLVMTEANQINVEGFFPDSAQEYITVGYRFGKVMPHVTYAASRVTDGDERPDNAVIPALCAGPGTLCLDAAGTTPFPVDTLARLLESPEDSVTLGVRYDFLPNAALKVDWTHVLDTHGSFALFTRDDGNVFYGAKPDEDINVYRVVVDVVF